MPTRIGRFLNAVKNANGTTSLEIGHGNPVGNSYDLQQIVLTAAEATALDTVLTGVTGTKTAVQHSIETVDKGYEK